MIGVPLSVLEIPAFVAAHPTVDVRGVVEVAQTIERLGYRRIWYAEHHKSLAIAPFPPAVTIAHVASQTSAIRIGSGGVLAVNHVPLTLAEQFGALTSFFPGRIDLGIGRGPGTFDEPTAGSSGPSRWSGTPQVMLSVQTVCAETDAEAEALARPTDINRAGHAIEKADQPLLDLAAAAAYEFTAAENDVVAQLRAHSAQGTPQVVRAKLTELAGRFGADELMLWTPIVDSAIRARSFELIMKDS